jgi:hypothetical protein
MWVHINRKGEVKRCIKKREKTALGSKKKTACKINVFISEIEETADVFVLSQQYASYSFKERDIEQYTLQAYRFCYIYICTFFQELALYVVLIYP